MSVNLTIHGMTEFLQALRDLPEHLANESGTAIMQHARQAEVDIRSRYEQHRHTGNLARGVRLDNLQISGAGAKARVRSTARHASIFEHGTQIRHTDLGWNRGRMPAGGVPPGHIFIPIAVRERRGMLTDLVAMMRREGFTVTGL